MQQQHSPYIFTDSNQRRRIITSQNQCLRLVLGYNSSKSTLNHFAPELRMVLTERW